MEIKLKEKEIKRIVASLLILLPALLTFNPAMGQEPRSLDFDEIQVIAPYEPTISDAFKINENPVIDDTLQVDIHFDYSIFPKKIPTRFEVEPISAARMRGEPLAKLYRGLVKGGLGTYSTPYFEARYNTLRSNEYALGVNLKHLSSSGEIKDYQHSGYSDNLARVYGKRFFRNHTLDADLNFERNVVHYYGFRRDDFLDQPLLLDSIDNLSNQDIRQRFNHFSTGIGFGTHHTDSARLSHQTNLEYNYTGDRYEADEHQLSFRGNLGRELSADPTGQAKQQYFSLRLGADYFSSRTPRDTAGTGIITIHPRLYSDYDQIRFFVGLDASVQSDTASYIRFYPQIGGEVDIIDRVLIAHAALSGGLEKHTLYSMSQTNPFINTAIPYAFMNRKYEIGGGLKGSLSNYASYNISLNSTAIDNYPFFVTDTATAFNNQFTIAYDDIRHFNFRTEILSQWGKRLNVRLAGDFFQYSLDEEIEAWHTPTLQLSLNLKYNIQNKIIITADAFARNSTYGKVYDEQGVPRAKEIHGFHVDTNFGIEYRYTRILSVFFNFYNVQNQPLERWLNYPSQRFNFMGGVAYSF